MADAGFNVPETVGHGWTDGAELHLVLVGEDRTICGLDLEGLSEPLEGEQFPLCPACDKRERWERAGG